MWDKLMSFRTCSYLLFYNVQWQLRCSKGSLYSSRTTDGKLPHAAFVLIEFLVINQEQGVCLVVLHGPVHF